MFSFHRPKVYRSSTGCCICKAKSSSSRFTDSKKYEEDFLECFKLETPRQGEICNACVLLVKRWKKLPAGSDRNWQHVVDARAGPGMKSFTKFKTKNKKITGDKNEKPIKKKLTVAHFDREYSPGLSDKSEGPEDLDNDMDFLPEDGPSVNSSRNGSTGGSDSEEAIVVPEMKTRNRRRKGISKRLEEIRRPNVSGFIDLGYWTKETICCGAIFRGRNDEILLDYSHFKPCAGRLAMCRTNNKTTKGPETATVPVTTTSPGAVTSTTKGLYTSDSSSDSGYDDCSNQGYVGMSPPRQVPNPSADVTETDLTCHETIFSTAQEEEVAVHSDGDVIMTSETPTICAN